MLLQSCFVHLGIRIYSQRQLYRCASPALDMAAVSIVLVSPAVTFLPIRRFVVGIQQQVSDIAVPHSCITNTWLRKPRIKAITRSMIVHSMCKFGALIL